MLPPTHLPIHLAHPPTHPPPRWQRGPLEHPCGTIAYLESTWQLHEYAAGRNWWTTLHRNAREAFALLAKYLRGVDLTTPDPTCVYRWMLHMSLPIGLPVITHNHMAELFTTTNFSTFVLWLAQRASVVPRISEGDYPPIRPPTHPPYLNRLLSSHPPTHPPTQ